MTNRFIPGGNAGLNSGRPGGRGQGVWANHSAMTPLYHTGGDARADTSMARMYVTVEDLASYAKLRLATPERARQMMDVLCPESGIGSTGVFDFILSRANMPVAEKVQVSEVLADTHVARFFGEGAPTWSFNGFLYNTQQDQWYNAFYILYHDILRGSRLAQYEIPLRLVFAGREVIGSLVSMTSGLSADMETVSNFSFNMLVREVRMLATPIIHNLGAGDQDINVEVSPALPIQQQLEVAASQARADAVTAREARAVQAAEIRAPGNAALDTLLGFVGITPDEFEEIRAAGAPPAANDTLEAPPVEGSDLDHTRAAEQKTP